MYAKGIGKMGETHHPHKVIKIYPFAMDLRHFIVCSYDKGQ